MNRQERRRLGVKKKDPMVSIKQSDIDAWKSISAMKRDTSPCRSWLSACRTKQESKSKAGRQKKSRDDHRRASGSPGKERFQ